MTDLIFASANEYAAHRGVDPSLIRRYRRDGRLVLDETGRIVVHASDAKLNASLHPTRGGKHANVPTHATDEGMARPSANARERKSEGIDLATEVAREKRAKATLAELELAEKCRVLVSRAEVESLVRGLAISAREALLALPGRLAPELALIGDVDELERKLHGELLLVCRTMQESLGDAPVLRDGGGTDAGPTESIGATDTEASP